MSILRQQILSIAMTIKIVCSQIWIKIILCLKKKKTYSRSSIKNSKELLDNFDSRSCSNMSSTETFDFCTLYATIPREN